MQDENWAKTCLHLNAIILVNWEGYMWPIAQELSRTLKPGFGKKLLSYFFSFNSITDILCLHQETTFKCNLCTLQNVKATCLLPQFLRYKSSQHRQQHKHKASSGASLFQGSEATHQACELWALTKRLS